MKKLFFLVPALFFFAACFSQNTQLDRAKMEKERQEIQRELQEIQSAYNNVKGKKKATLGQVTVLQKKLDIQGRYIGNINKEIKNLSDDIYLSNLEINHLQVQLDTLKAQYARSVIYAYKNKSSYDFLNFIFSANNFNDALKRVQYLKSYRAYRQQQVTSIIETQQLIRDRKQQLLGKQTRKKTALQNQEQQVAILEDQKREKDAAIAKLKSQEKDLSREIASRKRKFQELKKQIDAVIRREIREAKDKADLVARKNNNSNNTNTENGNVTGPVNKTSFKPKDYLNLNASDVALNASFEKNKRNLPWPVDNGYVSIPFGRSKVGALETDNSGITISTPSKGSAVKAVFNGEVSAVSNIGDGLVVMIRHGKYLTIYSNLSSASVSKGAAVSSGQIIGRTNEAENGEGGELLFLVMNEYKYVNPESWLRPHH